MMHVGKRKKEKIKLVVVHFLPVEYYPPTTNLLNFLKEKSIETIVFSTHNTKNRKVYYQANTKIIRFFSPDKIKSKFLRLYAYFHFNIFVFIRLLFIRPRTILYYETYSALPVYWYLKIFKTRTNLLIHFHEYFDQTWYKKGMKLINFYHKKELNYLFEKASYISQTNKTRANLFLDDNKNLDINKLYIIPNYPPKNWYKSQQIPKNFTYPIRLIMIGSIDVDNFYLQEICEFVAKNSSKLELDIYSYNISPNTIYLIKKYENKGVQVITNGIEYDLIPKTLESYDVGLILYKTNFSNVVNSVSNKLFEYLAADLDVWFPDHVKETIPFATKSTYPKVLKINYNKLDDYNLEDLVNRDGLTYKSLQYNCEDVYEQFLNKITL